MFLFLTQPSLKKGFHGNRCQATEQSNAPNPVLLTMSCDRERGVYVVLSNRREGRSVLVQAAENVCLCREGKREELHCAIVSRGVGETLKIWVMGGMLGQHGGYITALMKFIDGGLLPSLTLYV